MIGGSPLACLRPIRHTVQLTRQTRATLNSEPGLIRQRQGSEQVMNILICEGNAVTAMKLGWTLQDMGHRVCGIARTSIKAMEQCALKQPDLVLVDRDLADGRTGLGLVGALSQLNIPSILIADDDGELPEPSSAKAVLCDPLDEEQVAQALAALEANPVPQAPVVASPAPQPVNEPPAIAPSLLSRWAGWLWQRPN
jgi:CheY-like chemotaxis protein